MLIQFSLTNFRNFKETATLDLSEAKITEFKEHLYQDEDGLRVIPMAALYGAHGSGKTNFLQGLWTLRQLILDATNTGGKKNQFFLSDENTPVEYDILFRIANREYEYQLKLTPYTVVEENLFGRDLDASRFDVLFDRDSEGVFLCESWKNIDVSSLPDHFPLLYFLGKNTQEQELQTIIHFFQNIIFFSGNPNDTDCLIETIRSNLSRQELLAHLRQIDLDITNITENNHQIILTHTIQEQPFDLLWEEESLGIRYLLVFLSSLMRARKENSLMLADNPETYLHSKTLQYLYRFVGKNASAHSSAQLLVATHETSNMNNSIFRRDELWLVSKAEDGSSQLYTLALFLKENGEKVRKDEVYSKQYLEGRYGAIPNVLFQ